MYQNVPSGTVVRECDLSVALGASSIRELGQGKPSKRVSILSRKLQGLEKHVRSKLRRKVASQGAWGGSKKEWAWRSAPEGV